MARSRITDQPGGRKRRTRSGGSLTRVVARVADHTKPNITTLRLRRRGVKEIFGT